MEHTSPPEREPCGSAQGSTFDSSSRSTLPFLTSLSTTSSHSGPPGGSMKRQRTRSTTPPNTSGVGPSEGTLASQVNGGSRHESPSHTISPQNHHMGMAPRPMNLNGKLPPPIIIPPHNMDHRQIDRASDDTPQDSQGRHIQLPPLVARTSSLSSRENPNSNQHRGQLVESPQPDSYYPSSSGQGKAGGATTSSSPTSPVSPAALGTQELIKRALSDGRTTRSISPLSHSFVTSAQSQPNHSPIGFKDGGNMVGLGIKSPSATGPASGSDIPFPSSPPIHVEAQDKPSRKHSLQHHSTLPSRKHSISRSIVNPPRSAHEHSVSSFPRRTSSTDSHSVFPVQAARRNSMSAQSPTLPNGSVGIGPALGIAKAGARLRAAVNSDEDDDEEDQTDYHSLVHSADGHGGTAFRRTPVSASWLGGSLTTPPSPAQSYFEKSRPRRAGSLQYPTSYPSQKSLRSLGATGAGSEQGHKPSTLSQNMTFDNSSSGTKKSSRSRSRRDRPRRAQSLFTPSLQSSPQLKPNHRPSTSQDFKIDSSEGAATAEASSSGRGSMRPPRERKKSGLRKHEEVRHGKPSPNQPSSPTDEKGNSVKHQQDPTVRQSSDVEPMSEMRLHPKGRADTQADHSKDSHPSEKPTKSTTLNNFAISGNDHSKDGDEHNPRVTSNETKEGVPDNYQGTPRDRTMVTGKPRGTGGGIEGMFSHDKDDTVGNKEESGESSGTLHYVQVTRLIISNDRPSANSAGLRRYQ